MDLPDDYTPGFRRETGGYACLPAAVLRLFQIQFEFLAPQQLI
jgi:hypothetical protein